MIKAKVILIEDQLIPAYDMRKQLQDLGYEVLGIFTKAETALKFLEENQGTETFPDVVVTDISLPGKMDGIEATRIITEKYHCAVVYLTGLYQLKVIEEALATRPYAFLIKPFDIYNAHINIQISLYLHKLENEIRSLKAELKKYTG